MWYKKLSLIILTVIWMVSMEGPTVHAADRPLNAEQLQQKLDAFLPAAMEQVHIPGATVVVTQQDRIIFSKGYGYADLDHKMSMNPATTVLPLGSLNKTLTAAAVMQLAGQKRLDLHTDIREYIDPMRFSFSPYAGRPVTLHDLLTHTSGLDEAIYGVIASSPEKTISLADFVQHYLHAQPPVREPGKQYAYSNAGLGLAALVVESRSGQSYPDYLFRKLFDPLQMNSASINAQPSDVTARSYIYKQGSYEALPYSYINLRGAGGVSATSEDWAHFMIALVNNGRYQGRQILSPQQVAEMEARQYTEHPDLEGIGYGLFRQKLANGRLALYHNGDVDGFSARMELIPDEQIGILVVINATAGDSQVLEQVTSEITGLLPAEDSSPPPARTDELSQLGIVHDVTLQSYEGRYTVNLGQRKGPGKWLQWLGYKDFVVKSTRDGLLVHGPIPDGEPSDKQRHFVERNNGLFENDENGQFLFFRDQGDGQKELVFPAGATAEHQSGWWHFYRLSLFEYMGMFLFWTALALTLLVRSIWCFFRRKSGLKRMLPLMLLSGFMTVYLIVQLLYGNSEAITRGYPQWYEWGLLSLPVLASVPAVMLAAAAFRQSSSRKRNIRTGLSFAVLLVYVCSLVFLNAWEMLSIPSIF